MLGKIIQIVGEGRIMSIEKIAENIGTSPEITQTMIDDLVHREYLRETVIKDASACKTPCKGCDGNCSCHRDDIRFWELTDKIEPVKARGEEFMKSLDTLVSGDSATIHMLSGGEQFISRVTAMGFTPDTEVSVLRNEGYGPLIVSLRDTEIAIGRGEAKKITLKEALS